MISFPVLQRTHHSGRARPAPRLMFRVRVSVVVTASISVGVCHAKCYIIYIWRGSSTRTAPVRELPAEKPVGDGEQIRAFGGGQLSGRRDSGHSLQTGGYVGRVG